MQCSCQVGELAQQDARAECNSKRVVTTTLISTYVEHLETKRRYRTRRRRRRGGRVAARRRDAMVDLALGSHPSHSGEKAHKVGVACKKSCSQNIAWPRRRPRPAKHLPPSSGGTVAAVAAVWWRRRRPQNIITLTFITLFSVVVSPTMCHSLLYTGPVCTAVVPPPLHAPQFDRIFSFL